MKTLLYFFLFLNTLCVCIIIPIAQSQCIDDQKLSLLHFQKSLVFDASFSSKLISWNSSVDCCSWAGVTCSTDGRVLGLDISSEHVSGGIGNSSSLFLLEHLQSLNLADNRLGKGSQLIPSAIGELTNLRYLNLSKNDYSGQIPIEISHLRRLVILDISDSMTELNLESPNLHMLFQNLTDLRELYLDDVQISAQGNEWCQSISSSLPNLRVLSLSNCNLRGPFHHSLAKLKYLSMIHLEGNNISAPVPTFFAKFSNLTFLNLAKCGLLGTIPKEIIMLPSLQSIDLSNNENLGGSLPDFHENASLQYLDLSWTNFSGPLPKSIGNLNMLKTFAIGNCRFSGTIPPSMSNLTQLVDISMYRNNFEGSIPSFSRAKNLDSIDLSSNHLAGDINSTQWGNLTNLLNLGLSDNLLHGNIPASLFSLPLLKTLHLSNNQFSGQLTEISNFSSDFLYSLDLSRNNLEGPIPMSIFNLQGLYILRLSFNRFTGSFPLDGLKNLGYLFELDLSHNSLLLNHDVERSSYSSLPDLEVLGLASGKLRRFPEFLRNQSSLFSLDLSDNQIQGEIPNWIWSFNYLNFLNLSCNSLETMEGPVGNITSLQMLDLHSNQLHGQIPIFSSLGVAYLDYSRNNFNSTIPTTIGDLRYTTFISLSSNNLNGIIPGSICNSEYLQILDLSNNSLSGTVPQCLTTIPTLAVLNLRKNNLTNVDNLSQDCNLKTLDISRNQIQGRFLQSLVNCTKLEVLNLGNNQITNPFPCILKNTSTLRVLVLRSNKFYGGIACPKTSSGSWPVIQIIDLAQNNFTGVIPGASLTTWQAMMANEDLVQSKLNHLQFQDNQDDTVYYQDTITIIIKDLEIELVKILTIFTSIDLSGNKFDGSIPEEIGQLKSLHFLNLSNNAFTNAIPLSLSNLSQLESLDLSKNKLSGPIPPQLTRLTFLSVLDLSYNQLVGRIPSSNQFLTFPKASFEGNKDLWGFPLTTTDNRTELSPPTSARSLPNSGDEINWNIISIEIGYAFGFGLAIGSLLFCKIWRVWYYRAMYNILFKIFPQLEQRFGDHRRHVHINQRWRH